MPAKPADLSKMVVEIHERTGALEKKGAVDHERITVLERQSATMAALPGRVDALTQQVTGLDKSMIREIDGLREQQKAHKEETAQDMAKGFDAVSKSLAGLGNKVDGIVLKDIRSDGVWAFVYKAGASLVGFFGILLAIVETLKAFRG